MASKPVPMQLLWNFSISVEGFLMSPGRHNSNRAVAVGDLQRQ